MPVADEDVVVGINLNTGLTENVTIPATNRNIRPVVLHPEYGLMTLTNIQETLGGTLYNNNTELYDIDELEVNVEAAGNYYFLIEFIRANVPYIQIDDDGQNFNYISTDTFNYQLDYAIVSASGTSQVEITREEDLQRSGGAGGRGGGGGGDGSGSQDGDGRGGQDEQIRPFPAPPESNDEGLEHTCSDDEPQPGEPGEPGEPSEQEPCAACAAGIPKGQKGQGPTQTESGTLSGSGQNQMDSGDSQESGESGQGQGESQSQGQGDSQGDASGQGQGEAGESQGSGSGESSGEGQGSGDGEGQGEGEGSGQGSGSSSGSGGGESSGQGAGQAPGQGQGEGEGSEGDGESQGEAPPSSNQPTPSSESGEASGGSEQSPQQPSLLDQLLEEQAQREGQSPSDDTPGPMNPDDFMDDSDVSGPNNTAPTDLPDNYDDIFDESSPFGPQDDGPAMNPDDFMDMPPQDSSPADEELPFGNDDMTGDEPSSAPRPFENLSDDELQQLIDELRESPDPTNPDDFMEEDDDVPPGPSPSPDPTNPPSPDQPSDTPGDGPGEGPPSNTNMPNPGPNQQNSNEQMPDLSNSSSTPESGQSWLWTNVGTGELYSGPSAPSTGIWVHVLFADFGTQRQRIPISIDYDVIMTFDEVRRVLGNDATYYQPLPTMMTIDFDDEVSHLIGYGVLKGMEGQYWDIEFDEMAMTISISFNYLEQSPDTRPRWVPMSSDDEDLTSSTYDETRAAAQAMLDQINEENQMANDAGIPTGYGEGSTSPFVPESESNAQLQQDAAQAGADAAKGDAQMAQEGSSNETDNARQSAQQNARDAAAANDLDAGLEAVSDAVANAMRANASADPNNQEDVNNRNQAMSAANEAIESLSELLDENQLDRDVQEMLDGTRESLNELEVGETPSMAQDLAQQAKDARDRAMEANNPIGSADNAMEATESAIQARQEANPGDDKDREAVQDAINMAQQAIDAATQAGAEGMDTYQQALDEVPAFNDLDELAVDAEARMRDTMPGEFADINNPDLAEDMMAVADQAVKNLEAAVEQANPANQGDRDATEYIAQKTQQTIDNVEGSWSGDPEEIEELRERVNQALADFSETIENICALWNPETMSWYRGVTGDILIFENMTDALVYGVQKNLIPATVTGVPEDWRTRNVIPIGVGGVI